MTGYDFHREARLDLEHIWEFVAIDNVDAANRLIEEILASVRALVPFPNVGRRRPDPHRDLFVFPGCAII
jgi:plasmid stabilization system protein ParE